MNVGALRAALALLPDDVDVVVECENDSYIRFAHLTRSVYTTLVNGRPFLVVGTSGRQVEDLPGMSSYEDDDDDIPMSPYEDDDDDFDDSEDGHPRDEAGRLVKCDDTACETCR